MLTALRAKGASWALKILFGILILSFAAWGVPDFYRAIQPVPTAATVGGKDITAEELRSAVDRDIRRLQQTLQGQMQPEFLRQFGVVDRTLDGLIERRVLESYAESLGMVVPDDVFNLALRSNPQLVDARGNVDPGRVAELRRQLRMGEAEFAADLRRDILSGYVVRAVTAGVQVPTTLAESIYAYRAEQRGAQTLVIPDSRVVELPEPDDQSIERFHSENAARYQAPEYRAVTLVRLRPEDYAARIDISDDAIAEEYDLRRSEFDIPERRQIVQAVLPDEAAATELADKVRQGASFAEALKAATGGDPLQVGSYAKADLQKRLGDVFGDAAVGQRMSEALFAAAPGSATEPAKGPIGWHVLSVGEIDPPSLQPLDQVRDKLRRELAVRQALDDLIHLANELDDELAAGTALDAAAEKLALPVTTLPAVDRTGKGADGQDVPGVDDQIVKIAFETGDGDESPLTDTPDGGYVIVRVDGIRPAATRPLEEVRNQVIADWQAEQRKKATDETAQSLVERIEAGSSIGRIAHEMGVAVQQSQSFTRTGGDPAAAIDGALAQTLFAAKLGEVVSGRAPGDDGSVVAVLTDIKPADIAASKPQIEQLEKTLSRSMSNDIYDQLSEGLRATVGVTTNRALIDSLYR
jgi:peptidyl-prolyl cis-trans isomerase D